MSEVNHDIDSVALRKHSCVLGSKKVYYTSIKVHLQFILDTQ